MALAIDAMIDAKARYDVLERDVEEMVGGWNRSFCRSKQKLGKI